MRDDPETATVITVPAAFNQVKKESILEAANMAGIGRVALMQKPVAAVMCVMRSANDTDGAFLIYDLGGGTFDVSIAMSTNGKVNLLTQEGKEMCGGRDWDRKIFDSIVVPYLRSSFALPDDFINDETYRKLKSISLFAIEQAKIELSLKPSSEKVIIQSDDLACKDLHGKEIYLDVPLSRNMLNPLIDDIIDETIEISRAAMKNAGLSSRDISRLVFIGGPTNYNYLRDRVSTALASPADTSVNPMTAVAEGASIFAESIDWSSEHHDRKPTRADIAVGTSLYFHYESRAAGDKARVVCSVKTSAKLMFQVRSDDTGWLSGMLELKDGVKIELPLSKQGDNSFSVVVYDKLGRKIPVPVPKITITKTFASVEAIPASHSIAVTALDRLGGAEGLVYLIRKDEALPKKGRITFKAAQTLKPDTDESLNFNLWEGEIETPYDDNRFIGVYKISSANLLGNDIIPAGSEIVCDYEMSDGGALSMSASVPCLGTEFARKNFYFHDEAKLDLTDTAGLAEEGQDIIDRIDDISRRVNDPRLGRAREKAESAASLSSRYIKGEEEVQEAYSELYEAKKILAQIRKEHSREIKQMELEDCVSYFNQSVKKYADASEIESFTNLARTAQGCINDSSFERYIREMWGKITNILWRQDWFVIDEFKRITQSPSNYHDTRRFDNLRKRGMSCIESSRIDDLRTVIIELLGIMKSTSDDDKRLAVNIIRG